LNDVWRYNTSTNQWTWVCGDNTIDNFSTIISPGVFDVLNKPGSRFEMSIWYDTSSNCAWLFGGQGYASSGLSSYLNDVWKFSNSILQWAYVTGDIIGNAMGEYGVKGTATINNKPGSRYGAASWVDGDDMFWMMGGYGFTHTTQGYLNDIWTFDKTTNMWTWVNGDSLTGIPGEYGTLGVPSPQNKPGGRIFPADWTDNDGNLWLFSGNGFAASGSPCLLSDLWKFQFPCAPPSAPSNTTPTANLSVCQGNNTELSAGGSGILTWHTLPSGGSILATGPSFTTGSLTHDTTFYVQDSTCGASLRTAIAVTVFSAYAFTEDHTICNGDTYHWQGADYSSANTYTANYTSINGCDSNYTLNLTVNPTYAFTEDQSICNGDIYHWQGVDYTIANTYVANYSSIQGCDSNYTLNLSVQTVDIGITLNNITITADSTADAYQWLDCNNAFAPIPGEDSQSFIASSNGDYAVVVTQGICSDTSTCIQVISVGMSDISMTTIEIFPLPTHDVIYIRLNENAEKYQYTIRDLSGRIILTGETTSPLTAIDLKDLANGSYLLFLDGQFRYFKLIKI
jgi:hypothetical protein